MTDSEAAEFISVEVAYATPQRQVILPVRVAAGTSALEAVLQSGIVREFPQIDPDQDPMGIFSRRLDGKVLPFPGDYLVKDRDRVEIYRPLLIDPKQARLQRAKTGNDKTDEIDETDNSNKTDPRSGKETG